MLHIPLDQNQSPQDPLHLKRNKEMLVFRGQKLLQEISSQQQNIIMWSPKGKLKSVNSQPSQKKKKRIMKGPPLLGNIDPGRKGGYTL